MRIQILCLSCCDGIRTVIAAVIVIDDILRLPNAHRVAHFVHDVERSANQQNLVLSAQIESTTEVAFNRVRDSVSLCDHAIASSPLSFQVHPFASLAARRASCSA